MAIGRRALLSVLLIGAVGAGVLACPAVFPVLRTPLREPMQGQALVPAPPPELRWVAFKEAHVPSLTNDGRRWGTGAADTPDVYVKLIVNGEELLRSAIARGTLEPRWSGEPSGNFHFQRDDRLRVEMWDARAVNDRPIGVKDIGTIPHDDTERELDVTLSSGATVRLAFEPAHGRFGYGFHYELRMGDVYVVRMHQHSPAARAGIRIRDQIVSVDGESVKQMGDARVQGTFAIRRMKPILLELARPDGSRIKISLSEGAIYPLFGELQDVI